MRLSITAPYATAEDILATVCISDSADTMCLDQLAPEIQAHIAAGRQSGRQLVSARWPTGQFALMFCEPDTHWPSIKNIITAYQQCHNTSQKFPEGTLT